MRRPPSHDDSSAANLWPLERQAGAPSASAQENERSGVSSFAQASKCFVLAWSVVELPWELDASSDVQEVAAIVAAKALLFAIVGFSLRGSRFARYAFLFVCLMSVLAMAPEIPGEYERSRLLAALTAVECIGKLAAFAAVALDFRRGV